MHQIIIAAGGRSTCSEPNPQEPKNASQVPLPASPPSDSSLVQPRHYSPQPAASPQVEA